jgi:hypothetical protein
MITDINEFKKYQNINEVGEGNSETYEYTIHKTQAAYDVYTCVFMAEDLRYILDLKIISIDFNEEKKMNIDFTADFTHDETNRGNQYKIMATILKIIKEVLDQESNVVLFTFEGKDKKNQKENQRNNFYIAYIKKHLGINWKIVTLPHTSKVYVYRTDSLVYSDHLDFISSNTERVGFTENMEPIDFDKYEIESYIDIVNDPEKIKLYESSGNNLQSTNLNFKAVGRNDILWITAMLKPRNSSKANRIGEIGVIKCKVLETFYGMNKLKQLRHTDKIF